MSRDIKTGKITEIEFASQVVFPGGLRRDRVVTAEHDSALAGGASTHVVKAIEWFEPGRSVVATGLKGETDVLVLGSTTRVRVTFPPEAPAAPAAKK